MSEIQKDVGNEKYFVDITKANYIKKNKYFQVLNDYAKSQQTLNKYLIITGERGIGKTSLIVNWLKNYKISNDEKFIIEYYVGKQGYGLQVNEIISEIIMTIKSIYGINKPLSKDITRLKDEFTEWLSLIKEECLIIIDGLDFMEGDKSFFWLPKEFPSNVKIILTTSSFESLMDFNKNRLKYYHMEIKGLNENDIKKLSLNYLNQNNDIINEFQIFNNKYFRNPLFLTIMLNEIKLNYFDYTKVNNLEELLNIMIGRLEETYGFDITKLFISLILISRRGLTIIELKEIIQGEIGSDIIVQSNIQKILFELQYFILYKFDKRICFKEELKNTLYKRYDTYKDDSVNKLILYFENEINSGRNINYIRVIEELLWHLKNSEKYDKLFEMILDPEIFCKMDLSEIQKYIVVLQDNNYDVKQGYLNVAADLKNDINKFNVFKYKEYKKNKYTILNIKGKVADILNYNSYNEEFKIVGQDILEECYSELKLMEKFLGKNNLKTINHKNYIAKLLYDLGRKEEALIQYEDIISCSDEMVPKNKILTIKYKTAQVLNELGKKEEASKIYKDLIKVKEKEKNSSLDMLEIKQKTAENYFSLGRVNDASKEYYDMIYLMETSYFKEYEYRENIKLKRARLYKEFGHKEEALNIYNNALADLEKIYESESKIIQCVKFEIASLLYKLNRKEECLLYLNEIVEIMEKTLGKEHSETLVIKESIADVVFSLGRKEEALITFKEILAIREKLFGKEDKRTAKLVNKIAEVVYSMGEKEKSLEICNEILPLYERLWGSESNEFISIKYRVANILAELQHTEDAIKIYKDVYKIRVKKYGENHGETLSVKFALAKAFYITGKKEKAKSLYKDDSSVMDEDIDQIYEILLNSKKKKNKRFRNKFNFSKPFK